MDENDTIGPEFFKSLPSAFREAVQQCRGDLLVLDLSIRHGLRRTGTRTELRTRLAQRWPDRYGDEVPDEAFDQLILVADVWDVYDLDQEEQARRLAEDHPDGKWSLDQVRQGLAKLKPERYGRLNNTQIADILRKEGIPVQTIRIGGATHKGIRQEDVRKLLADREETRRRGVT